MKASDRNCRTRKSAETVGCSARGSSAGCGRQWQAVADPDRKPEIAGCSQTTPFQHRRLRATSRSQRLFSSGLAPRALQLLAGGFARGWEQPWLASATESAGVCRPAWEPRRLLGSLGSSSRSQQDSSPAVPGFCPCCCSDPASPAAGFRCCFRPFAAVLRDSFALTGQQAARAPWWPD